MHPIHGFYLATLRTLNKREWSEEDIQKIEKLAASTPGLSPHFNNPETLEEVFDDSNEVPLCDLFVAAAFKDLSSLGTRAAQRLFARIIRRLEYGNGYQPFFIMGSTKEKDGSATIILRIRSLKAFEGLLAETDNIKGSLDAGAMIHET